MWQCWHPIFVQRQDTCIRSHPLRHASQACRYSCAGTDVVMQDADAQPAGASAAPPQQQQANQGTGEGLGLDDLIQLQASQRALPAQPQGVRCGHHDAFCLRGTF